MFKKLIGATLIVFTAFAANAAKFDEGTHYRVLDLPKSETPNVTEFFSFYCPHCERLEPTVEALKKQLPENAKMLKNHVSFMGGKMGVEVSKAYATAELLKVEDKIVPVLFHRIHKLRQAPKSVEELRQIFIDEGVSAEKFDKTFNSFPVNAMANRYMASFKKTGLTGVPALVVNNKYVVQMQGLRTMDDLYSLVDYLLVK
ncbi:thiol:disulfide interchange protein [Veronia nyctiphanis]|uniref:Thiol:disulfide interchange protein n=1 Tax=Veronia nyctiphanis TaxID=1278244 RepID=A0A4Q0YXI0_9GAMM|nr:thiol:disulfide interchange protein DsbA/DsbL [Veronia nyctiphanis]RXJ73909.1 thiol:disulfide interchange protein [Veronia nyctiphanis]